MDDHMDIQRYTDGCPMAQVEVITGIERRRTWTEDQKRALVAEAFSSGVRAKDVMRRHDIPGSSLYNWRRQFMGPLPPRKKGSALTEATGQAFAQVVCARDGSGGGIEIEIGLSRVRIPGSTAPELAAAVVSALVRK
jgi:transposase